MVTEIIKVSAHHTPKQLASMEEGDSPRLSKMSDQVFKGAATVLLLSPSCKILLMKRGPSVTYPEEWGSPGGSIDRGETPRQAAIRELEEETGHKLSPESLTPLALYKVNDFVNSNLLVVSFVATAKSEFTPDLGDKPDLEDMREHTDYSWQAPTRVLGASSRLVSGLSLLLKDPQVQQHLEEKMLHNIITPP